MLMLASNLLQGPRVRLAALVSEDIPTVARWYQDAGFSRLFDTRPAYPRTESGLYSWLDDYQRSNNSFIFGVRLLDDNALIGMVELEGIMWSHQCGWLSIAIGDPANQGQGYGREAIELALQFAFQELNLHRVQLTVFAYNSRAITLYENVGFRREGVYREHLQRDGKRYDMYLYGILRREWEALVQASS